MLLRGGTVEYYIGSAVGQMADRISSPRILTELLRLPLAHPW